MRRVLVLIALLALMLGIRLLQATSLGSHDSLVLAAIGFVLLASFTVAEMGGTLSLPRVTGYILTGGVLAFFGILSPPVVLEMKMFNTLALGLIALGAGLELSLKQLGQVIKTLSGTVVAKVVLAVPLVAGAFYLYETNFSPLKLTSRAEISAMALVLGALSLGTSPSIALAIISETRSKGRLTDLVLGAAVLKDLVVVVALAVAVAVSRGLLAADGGAHSSISHVFVELGLSLCAGGLLGGLLILYIRYIKEEMLLFVAAVILVVAEISQLLHLELLLVFIAGGFVVRNFSKFEHDLLQPVETVSLPVFVVFFTIAGASIDLAATWNILPLALSLGLVRALAYYFASRIGNGFGREAARVRENAWLAYLPQAGVSLGLVGLATSQLPDVRAPLLSTGMAVVAVNLLVGPITLRLALRRAGEVPSSAGIAAADSVEGSDGAGPRPLDRIPEALRPPLLRVEKQLAHYFEARLTGPWERWASLTNAQYREFGNALGTDSSDPSEFWQRIRLTEQVLRDQSEECRDVYLEASKIVRTLPEVVVVPLEDGNRKVARDDSFGVRLKKRVFATGRLLTFNRRPSRRVPLRTLGRLHFEPRIAEFSAFLCASRFRLQAALLEELCAAEMRAISAENAETALRERVQMWKATVRAEMNSLSDRAVLKMVHEVNRVDSAYLAMREVRASGADEEVRSALGELGDFSAWQQALDADFARLQATRLSRRTREKVREMFGRSVLSPNRAAARGLTDLLDGLCTNLARFEQRAVSPDAIAAVELAGEFEKQDQAIREEAAQQFEFLTAKYRATLDMRAFSHTLDESLERLPEELVLPKADTLPSVARFSTDVIYRRLEFRRLAERLLARKAMADIENQADVSGEIPRDVCRRLFSLMETARIDIRSAAHEPDPDALREETVERIRRLLSAIAEIAASLSEELTSAAEKMERALVEQLDTLDSQLAQDGSSLGSLVGESPLQALRYAVSLRAESAKSTLKTQFERMVRVLRRILTSELTTELQAKYAAGDLDAESVRRLLRAYEPDASLGEYAKFFDGAPLRDPTFFIGHRRVLSDLLSVERAWLKGGPSSCLILGTSGNGRTSLLNLMQHGSYSRSLIRPNPFDWKRRVGLPQALAFELGCRPRASAIEKALSGRQTLVIIDDLEEWFSVGAEGVAQLESFLDLVVRTNKSTFWAVAAGSVWFDLVSSITEIGACFARVSHLEPLSADELRQIIEARHSESGRPIEYPSTWLSGLIQSERDHRDRDIFFRLLARASGGNLSRARDMWLHMAHSPDGEKITLRLSRAFVLGLPFLRHLSAEQIALLVSLTRSGPLSEEEAASTLGCEQAEVRRHASFLLTSGLLDRDTTGEPLFRVPELIAPLLETALREVKAL